MPRQKTKLPPYVSVDKYGYKLKRYEDSGPYHPDNVFKATGAENSREHWDRYRANPS